MAVVAGQPVRAEEHAHGAVGVFVYVDAGLYEMRAQAAFRQLQAPSGPGDGVVVITQRISRQASARSGTKAVPSCSGAIAKALLYSPT